MFERFTEQARQVIVFAQEEARTLGHNYIGAEHLLLALLRDEATAAAQTLAESGLAIEAARQSLLSRVPRGEPLRSGQIPFTPSGKQALEGSLKEAMATHAPAIGPEQLLLGVLKTDDDHVTSILADHRVAVDELRRSVLKRGAQSLRRRGVLKLEVFDALVLALDHRDEVMTIASHATSREDAVAALRERFAVSQQAARAILDLRVSSFTKAEQQRLARARTDLRAAVEAGGSGAPS